MDRVRCHLGDKGVITMIEKPYGDLQMKKEGRLNVQRSHRSLAERYKTPFWNENHALSNRVYEDDCTMKEAIHILVKICERLIDGVKKGSCTMKDLHYAMEVLSHIDFIYETGEIYDLYDGELYGLVEYLDGHDTIEEIATEFKAFRKKYPRL